MRRRIEVRFSHRLLAKGATLSEPESAMIDISRLLHVLSGSIVESSVGERQRPLIECDPGMKCELPKTGAWVVLLRNL